MEDCCPHRSSQLSLGRLVNGHIQCPFHGLSLTAGERAGSFPRTGPAAPLPKIFPMSGLSVPADGSVWVWGGQPRSNIRPSPGSPICKDLSMRRRAKPGISIGRAIEGLLDVGHLPFVHARTIGRDRKTLVNGPYTTLEDEVLRVWVSNQPDEGLPAVKPTQRCRLKASQALNSDFPILATPHRPRMRVVNVVAPVEEGHCVIYLRTYLKLPLPAAVSRFVARANNLANRYILAEDYPVIGTRHPRCPT